MKNHSKPFQNKRKLENPEENQKLFKNYHKPIIDHAIGKTVRTIRVVPGSWQGVEIEYLVGKAG